MFHLQDGFYFERTADNMIHIAFKPNNGTISVGIIVSPSAFASMMASVSARGETYETHEQGLAFLNQP